MKVTQSQATSQAQLDWTPALLKSATRQERDEIYMLQMSAFQCKSEAARFEHIAKALKTKILKRGAK